MKPFHTSRVARCVRGPAATSHLSPHQLMGVRQLIAARKAHVPIEHQWRHAPASEDEAYRFQDAYIAEATIGQRIGYKIGGTNQAERDALRLQHPYYGVLFDTLKCRTGEAEFDANKFFIRHVEPEIALVIGTEIDASRGRWVTADQVREATEKVIPAIEIADTAFNSKWNEVGGLSLIMDNGCHGRFVMGYGECKPADFDENLRVKLWANGQVIREGSTEEIDGGVFEMTAWLANFLGGRGLTLQKGEVVTTGSLMKPYPAKPEDEIKAEFVGLGHAELYFRP